MTEDGAVTEVFVLGTSTLIKTATPLVAQPTMLPVASSAFASASPRAIAIPMPRIRLEPRPDLSRNRDQQIFGASNPDLLTDDRHVNTERNF